MGIFGELNRRDVLKALSACAAGGLGKPLGAASSWQISSPSGLGVVVTGDGRYGVTASAMGWTFSGTLGKTLSNVTVTSGTDTLGDWQEISFSYDPARTSAIRVYNQKPIVLFRTTYGAAGANSDPFPSFSSYPQGLFTFAYGGLWVYKFGLLNSRSPWLFFDGQANSVVISPATNFMTAVTQLASDGSMQAAIDSRITSLPAGFTHKSVLAFGEGINAAFDSWGEALVGFSGKQIPANDSVTVLNKLSYWTDAVAAYYYYHESDPAGYVSTLLQIPPAFSSTPIGSLELDSWHYPKGSPPSWTNVGAGLESFQADPNVFPNGLGAFQQQLGVPLIAHTRWVDSNSPYFSTYAMSGNVSIDPLYWQAYANYMVANGVEVLEQDWLSSPAYTNFNLTDPDAFLDNMASAMQAAGRSIIYCMPLWTHLMQASKYSNVVAARVSNDGFSRGQWDQALFNSRIVSSVGVWPFADAFRSQNVMDVLISTLTAGPVASGDNIASVVAANLSLAVRSDGVIVKPDVPIVPTDATFLAQAQNQLVPNTAFTYTQHGSHRTAYFLAYDPTTGASSPLSFSPASLGISGQAYVYDYFPKSGELVHAGANYTGLVNSNGSYYIVAPLGPSGIAFLGDIGKFVTCGKKRIQQLTDDGTVHVTVLFAPGEESVALHFYTMGIPTVTSTVGVVGRPVREAQDRYRVVVRPAPGGTASLSLQASPVGRLTLNPIR